MRSLIGILHENELSGFQSPAPERTPYISAPLYGAGSLYLYHECFICITSIHYVFNKLNSF